MHDSTPFRRSEQKTSATARVALLVLIGVLCCSPGCVRRRMLIRSNPPGATVYVDNQLVGVTPCATDFTYYGTREFRFVKPGYETLTVKQPIPPPWYEWPGIDFVSENVVPREIQDYRTISYNLVPEVIIPTDHLLARGDQLRVAAQTGSLPATPINAPPPGPATLGPPIINPSATPLFLPPGNATLAPETLQPGVLVPSTTGGALPPGGVPLEPLPQPQ